MRLHCSEDAGEEGGNNGEKRLVELESEGDWDLVQVLDPGVPMEEEGDPVLVNREAHRGPRLIRHSGLRGERGREPLKGLLSV